jgi:hypothetical protein
MAKARSARVEKVIIYSYSADSESGRTNCDGVEIRSIACSRIYEQTSGWRGLRVPRDV